MDEPITSFSILLVKEILANVYNYHLRNKDYERDNTSVFKLIGQIIKSTLILGLRKLLKLTPICKRFNRDIEKLDQIAKNCSSFQKLYDCLEDDSSKQLLIKVLAYRVLGNTRVKLPLNTPRYWRRRRYIKTLITNTIQPGIESAHWKVKPFSLDSMGYNIKVFSIPCAVFNIFELKQYEYTNSNAVCKAEDGDVVIDAGGCWGDSSLYLAHEVGSEGQVYSFEFVPSNLEIFRRNISANPHIGKRIHIIQQPLWETSGKIFYTTDRGPSSRLTEERSVPDDLKIISTSIDDFVYENKLHKVDFIKMDIEGSEPQALKGSTRTLKEFRPKLAISVYHNTADFIAVSQFIISQNLGYRLYLGHYTIHSRETILFAKPVS